MNVDTAIRTRRSIREFTDQPVDRETIAALLAGALWSPSWGNTQAWEIKVITGEMLDKIRLLNRNSMNNDQASNPDVTMPESWSDFYMNRYREVGRQIHIAANIPFDDPLLRKQFHARMSAFYEAPALILFVVDQTLNLEYAMLDLGIFIQSFCLLAHELNLGTCIMGQAASYPENIRAVLPIPKSKRIIVGIALGYADNDATINHFPRQRGEVSEFVEWLC